MKFDDALLISLPVVIKAHQEKDGRRMVEVEASCEAVDLEGDVIEQKALLDSADTFVKSGHLDIDHISEIGHRMGIPNPDSFIVGRPTSVKDIGQTRTSVVGEIRRSSDGIHDPTRNRYDAFWDTMHSKPPVLWRASIYGFPPSDSVIDCSQEKCPSGATRYHIKAIDWKSLAFTRNPINDSIKGYAKVISVKSAIAAFLKAQADQPPTIPHFDLRAEANGFPYDASTAASSLEAPKPIRAFPMAAPRNFSEAVGHYHNHMRFCEHTGGINSTVGFTRHFSQCCGLPLELAEIFAHALMYYGLLERKRV